MEMDGPIDNMILDLLIQVRRSENGLLNGVPICFNSILIWKEMARILNNKSLGYRIGFYEVYTRAKRMRTSFRCRVAIVEDKINEAFGNSLNYGYIAEFPRLFSTSRHSSSLQSSASAPLSEPSVSSPQHSDIILIGKRIGELITASDVTRREGMKAIFWLEMQTHRHVVPHLFKIMSHDDLVSTIKGQLYLL